MSQASTRTETPRIVIETGQMSPVPSREGTVFTPTAEEELETILSREDTSVTPTTTSTTPAVKSRADNEDDDEDSKSKLEKISERADSGSLSQMSQVLTEDDKLLSRPGSKVKFQDVIEKPKTAPARSTGLGTTASEIRAFSRDAIKEREKINAEARNTYAGLDQRYSSLTDALLLVDNAYLGKIPSEERITSVDIISEPSPSYQQRATEAQIDEVFDVNED